MASAIPWHLKKVSPTWGHLFLKSEGKCETLKGEKVVAGMTDVTFLFSPGSSTLTLSRHTPWPGSLMVDARVASEDRSSASSFPKAASPRPRAQGQAHVPVPSHRSHRCHSLCASLLASDGCDARRAIFTLKGF